MPRCDRNELLSIAMMLDEEETQQPRKRRFWIHKSLRSRKSEGEFHTLYKELLKDEEKFVQYFRMSSVQHRTLLEKIKSKITKQNTTFREAVKPAEKLAVCLRFLATGDSFRTIASSYRLGETSVRRFVREVCESIVDTMVSECMPTPTKDQWNTIAKEVWDKWDFPNCLGAIAGKHVEIQAPANSGSLYYNYKKTFSVVLLALVDANYKFISVDVGAYGKSIDGGIYTTSTLGKALAASQLNVPEKEALPGTDIKAPFVFVADEAFPLKDYIMRPYPGAIMGDATKRVFNYRLLWARRIVENAFEILAQKFRIFNKRLNVDPEFANLIVLTACVLHNFIRGTAAASGTQNSESREGQSDQSGQSQSGQGLIPLEREGGRAPHSAIAVRETFAQYFVSPSGAVEWQAHV